MRIGWAPQEDLLAEPQGAAASQDGTQPAPLAWTASDGAPPIPGPPVPAWGTPTGGSAAAPAEPAVATGGVPTSLPQTCLGFPALSLAERPQGPGAPRKAARGGDPAANPEQGHAASGLGPAAGGGGAAPARFHVFVGNLPGDASDAALLDAFRGLPVLEARVMRDHATGRSKGFGFLGFPCAPLTLNPGGFPHALGHMVLPRLCPLSRRQKSGHVAGAGMRVGYQLQQGHPPWGLPVCPAQCAAFFSLQVMGQPESCHKWSASAPQATSQDNLRKSVPAS